MGGATDPGPLSDEPLRLRTILARIQGELADLGRCADGLQIAIGAIVTNSPSPLELDAQIKLQAADALSQRLERLAQLAGALEATIPDLWALEPGPNAGIDVADALARLIGAGRLAHARGPLDEGDCELF